MKAKLQSLLCLKINVEYQKYKEEQLKLPAEEVYANAYQIQSVMCIYELLLEMSERLPEEVLTSLVTFPELLVYLYKRWLKTEDSMDEEILHCLDYEVSEIHKASYCGYGRGVA